MNISSAKKFRRDMCGALGHTFIIVADNHTTTRTLSFKGICTRCKKHVGAAHINWTELSTRRFDIINRAKERIYAEIKYEIKKGIFIPKNNL